MHGHIQIEIIKLPKNGDVGIDEGPKVMFPIRIVRGRELIKHPYLIDDFWDIAQRLNAPGVPPSGGPV